MSEEVKTEKKEIKAKTVSLIVKVIDCILIVGFAVLKWLGKFPDATIGEICTVGAVIAAIFGDISLNTALDKFTKKEVSDEN